MRRVRRTYYDESGHPMLGSTLLRSPKFQTACYSCGAADNDIGLSRHVCLGLAQKVRHLCAAGNRRQRHTVLNSDANLRERGYEYTDAVVGSK